MLSAKVFDPVLGEGRKTKMADKTEKDSPDDHGTEDTKRKTPPPAGVGIAIGTCLGVGLGLPLQNPLLGIGVGVAFAAAFETAFKRQRESGDS